MFTGIISDVGVVRSATQHGDLRLVIGTSYDVNRVALGASIACSGCCLTVVERGADADGAWFAVDASAETIACTAPGMWSVGRRLNLERALKVGDELGGHIVTGHVDGVGTIASITEVGGSHDVRVRIGADLAPYLAAKGSVTVDGVSLTVNAVDDAQDRSGNATFALNIIPHTFAVTALQDWTVGQAVNVEIDILARYLKRMTDRQSRPNP